MKHIAFLLTQSLESPSGLGRYAPVARELIALGYRVSVIAPHHNYSPDMPEHEVREGIDVWCYGQMHVRKVGASRTYFSPLKLVTLSLRSAFKIARLVDKIQPDAIHVCKPQPINGLGSWLALRRNRSLPMYLDCDDYEAEANRTTGAWQRKILRYFEDRLPREAKAVSVNTRFLQKRVEGLGVPRERIHFVPNGVDRKRFEMKDESDRRGEWINGSDADSKRVLYLGSLSLVNHPVDLLLQAFEQVQREEPMATLLIVGGGSDYERLQNDVRQAGQDRYIRFAGVVDLIEAPAYYRAAYVTVDPVHDDAVARARSPLKIVESLAAGTPVVTADVGDRRWVLDEGRAGVLVHAGDASALAEGILRVLRDRELATSLAHGACEAREHFWWDVLIKEWAAIYERAK